MPPGHSCCIVGCTNASHTWKGRKKEDGVRFFRIPKVKTIQGSHVEDVTRRRRMAWVSAIGRPEITFDHISEGMRVCSRHFITGRPSYEMQESNPDWAPSLNLERGDPMVADTDRRSKGHKEKKTSQPSSSLPAKSGASGVCKLKQDSLPTHWMPSDTVSPSKSTSRITWTCSQNSGSSRSAGWDWNGKPASSSCVLIPVDDHVRMEDDTDPAVAVPSLPVSLDSCADGNLSPMECEEDTEQLYDPTKVIKEERSTEHQPALMQEGDAMYYTKKILPRADLNNHLDRILTCVNSKRNTEDRLNSVGIEESKRIECSKPFPVSLVKCERLQDADSSSCRYIQVIKQEPLEMDFAPGQQGERVVHPSAFESCGATPVVTLEEGCGGRSGGGKCEVLLSGSGGESLQQSPLPEEDFKVVLNPDYVEEEGMDCQEEREEQEAEVPLYFQVKVEPGISSPATSSVHEKQGPPSPSVHLPSSSSTEVPDTSQSLASQETVQSSHLDRTCARVPESKKQLDSKLEKKKKHLCSECEYRSHSRGNLKAHIEAVHRGLRNYCCPECDYRCGWKGVLNVHLESVHKAVKKFSCPSCDYQCARKVDLGLHVEIIHQGVKKHSCPHCEFKCGRRGDLNTHVDAVHRGVKNHFCSECQFRCGRRSNLMEHIRTVHRGIKKYSCPDCDYKCHRQNYLNTHMETFHRGIKKYSCTECEYKCGRRNNLKVHIESIHKGVKKHVCPHCEYRCCQKVSLKRHMEKFHSSGVQHHCPVYKLEWGYKAV